MNCRFLLWKVVLGDIHRQIDNKAEYRIEKRNEIKSWYFCEVGNVQILNREQTCKEENRKVFT